MMLLKATQLVERKCNNISKKERVITWIATSKKGALQIGLQL